jgi:hypothetical protein
MKIYNTLEELKKDIVGDTLSINDDIKINFDLNMPNLNIKAKNISAWDIYAHDINSCHIKARDINANNINALDIWAKNINAKDIDAHNIDAWIIEAENISYHFCVIAINLICVSIKPRTRKGMHWSLKGKVRINGKEQTQ